MASVLAFNRTGVAGAIICAIACTQNRARYEGRTGGNFWSRSKLIRARREILSTNKVVMSV